MNKKTAMGRDRNGKDVDYKRLILNCLDDVPTTPSGQTLGFSRSEMKDRDRIEKAVEDSGDEDEIKFEDADADNLKRLVTSMKWAIRHKDLLEFIDAIDNMENYKEKKKEKGGK